MQLGQFLVNKDGEKRKILGVCGEVIFLSGNNNFEKTGYHFTNQELIEYGWSPLEEPNKTKFVKITKDTFKDLEFKIKIDVEELTLPVSEKPWIPKFKEIYFWLDSGNGEIRPSKWEDDRFDHNRLEIYNVHRTREDAEAYKQKLIEMMGSKS